MIAVVVLGDDGSLSHVNVEDGGRPQACALIAHDESPSATLARLGYRLTSRWQRTPDGTLWCQVARELNGHNLGARQPEGGSAGIGAAGAVALLALVALLAVLWLAGGTDVPQRRPVPSPTLQEDDPGWDCSTMGNRVCGPKVGT